MEKDLADCSMPLLHSDRSNRERAHARYVSLISEVNRGLEMWSNTAAQALFYYKPTTGRVCGNDEKILASLQFEYWNWEMQVVSKECNVDRILHSFSLTDVIGAEICEENDSRILKVYCYPKKGGSGKRKADHIVLEIEEGSSSKAEDCLKFIVKAVSVDDTSNAPPKYLIIVNPVSGKQHAMNICQATVKPMFDQAKVSYEVFTTERGGHAKEWASWEEWPIQNENVGSNITAPERNLRQYDGIICIGGDGLLAEILQGVKDRPDSKEVFDEIKFGIIAGGTSNGLAMSVLHANKEGYGEVESTFLICKGEITRIDLSAYETASSKYTSFLTFSWGIIADVDLESEVIRCVGILRNDIWAVLRILNLRTYHGRFSYLPPSDDSLCNSTDMPGIDDPVPENWITIEDNFILFWACQVSHAASNTFSSPNSSLNDGIFRVLVVRSSCSRFELVKMFLEIETGGHIKHEACEVYDCVAYRLEPLQIGSYNDLDGEEIESGIVQGHVLPSVMQFFG